MMCIPWLIGRLSRTIIHGLPHMIRCSRILIRHWHLIIHDRRMISTQCRIIGSRRSSIIRDRTIMWSGERMIVFERCIIDRDSCQLMRVTCMMMRATRTIVPLQCMMRQRSEHIYRAAVMISSFSGTRCSRSVMIGALCDVMSGWPLLMIRAPCMINCTGCMTACVTHTIICSGCGRERTGLPERHHRLSQSGSGITPAQMAFNSAPLKLRTPSAAWMSLR